MSRVAVLAVFIAAFLLSLAVPAAATDIEGLACAGMCHASYVEMATDEVLNQTVDFTEQWTMLGILKDRPTNIQNPTIELNYDPNELLPPHLNGVGTFDEFGYMDDSFIFPPLPLNPTYESTGYVRWNLSKVDVYNVTLATDKMDDQPQSGLTEMIIERKPEMVIPSDGVYSTEVTVTTCNCFRVMVAMILEGYNESQMDAQIVGYNITPLPLLYYDRVINNKTLIVVFETPNATNPNPTGGTFKVKVYYHVTKFAPGVCYYKPTVVVYKRVRTYSDFMNNTFYLNTTGITYQSKVCNKTATFSTSNPINWTIEEFTGKIIELTSAYDYSQPEYWIDVETDKTTYYAGDWMVLNLTMGGYGQVLAKLKLEIPDFHFNMTRVKLVDLQGEVTKTLNVRLPCFPLNFTARWHAMLVDPTTQDILAEDYAEWNYVGFQPPWPIHPIPQIKEEQLIDFNFD
ncbi:hypothetical protein DRP04_14025 [Archaeoglobales archaeon]|nr:MAG: hypothetical protein DRP04_14025 [Archaeoglobales archaeon]